MNKASVAHLIKELDGLSINGKIFFFALGWSIYSNPKFIILPPSMETNASEIINHISHDMVRLLSVKLKWLYRQYKNGFKQWWEIMEAESKISPREYWRRRYFNWLLLSDQMMDARPFREGFMLRAFLERRDCNASCEISVHDSTFEEINTADVRIAITPLTIVMRELIYDLSFPLEKENFPGVDLL
jgi:hypothetical protein